MGANTVVWDTPDQMQKESSNTTPGTMYLIDPATNKAYAATGGGGGGGAIADVFGTATNITAATTFSGVPTISQLAANSAVHLDNPNEMATFIVEIGTSAFVGTLSFYGVAPDGTTLQLIGAHLRGIGTNANSTAISTASAINQVWVGSIASFKSYYVVCTAFTSGIASVQLGLSAAPYALAILNTVATLDTNSAASKADLDIIVTNTTGLGTQTTLAAAKADLDTIVTNTTGLGNQTTLAQIKANLDTLVTDNADLLADGDNLATIATNTGTSATQNTSTATQTTNLNTAFGAQGDSVATTDTGTFSYMSFIKRQLQKLTSIVTNTNAFIDTQTTGTVTNDNDVVSMALPGGQATAAVQILMGTLVGTLLFEVSPDSGTTWYSINGATPSGASLVSSATAAGSWRFNVSGMTNFRVRLHPTTSGTSGTITIRLSQGTSNVAVVNATTLGQAVMTSSAPVVIASDQPGLTQLANLDGLTPANVLAIINHLSSGSGILDSTGKPRQASLDRMTSWQGKGVGGANANITATVAGDTNLVFSVAPKTIMPGQKIQLAVGAGVSIETVIVSSSYAVSSTATSIPLQYPVVNANCTTAKWDIYLANGPGTASLLPTDLPVTMLAAYNNSSVLPISLVSAYADSLAASTTLASSPTLYNGASSDRQRGNLDNISLVASASYTTTQTSADQTNYNGRGLIITLDTTVVGSGSVTLEIDYKDPVSGKYIALLTGAAVTTVSTNVYTVYPGAPATTNVSANSPVPRTWRVKVVANNANAQTYSVGAAVIV